MTDLRDGEIFPCIGGPWDGGQVQYGADVLCIKADDGVEFVVRFDGDHYYRLGGRRWIYAGVVKENQ